MATASCGPSAVGCSALDSGIPSGTSVSGKPGGPRAGRLMKAVAVAGRARLGKAPVARVRARDSREGGIEGWAFRKED